VVLVVVLVHSGAAPNGTSQPHHAAQAAQHATSAQRQNPAVDTKGEKTKHKPDLLRQIMCKVAVAWRIAHKTRPDVITDFHNTQVYKQHVALVQPLEKCLLSTNHSHLQCESLLKPLAPYVGELLPELMKIQTSLGPELQKDADKDCGHFTITLPAPDTKSPNS